MNRRQFAVCIRNTGNEASLDPRKLYEVLQDTDSVTLDQLRVIDESGEDYLYPATHFALLALPESVQQAVADAV